MFFLYLILVIFIITILIIFSKIQVNISNIKFTTYKVNNRHLQENYQIEIKLYILKIVRIFKITVTKQKLEKLKLKSKSKLRKVEKKILNSNIKFDLNILEILKQLDTNIEKLNLKIRIGTENSALTSIIFGVISSVISIILKNKIKNKEKQIFNVIPIYTNENLLNIELDCIFSIKMIHIIYIIYILSKKGRDEKNVRTSNRRAYGYSYE